MYNDWYIQKISEFSDSRGNYLLDLMDKFGVNSIKDIPLNNIESYYDDLVKDKEW